MLKWHVRVVGLLSFHTTNRLQGGRQTQHAPSSYPVHTSLAHLLLYCMCTNVYRQETRRGVWFICMCLWLHAMPSADWSYIKGCGLSCTVALLCCVSVLSVFVAWHDSLWPFSPATNNYFQYWPILLFSWYFVYRTLDSDKQSKNLNYVSTMTWNKEKVFDI